MADIEEKIPDRIVAGDPVGSILADYWRTDGKNIPEGVPYKVEGIGQDKIPGTLDMSVIDDFESVSDKVAFAMARRLTREEGLFVGGSSGLITHVALRVAREIDDPNAFVVTMLCDTGERYLTKLYSDEWMRENQMLDTTRAQSWTYWEKKVTPQRRQPSQVHCRRPWPDDVQTSRSSHSTSNCVGSVSDWVSFAEGLENPKLRLHGERDQLAIPIRGQPIESVVKLLSKSNPAVLVRGNGKIDGIVTRSDMLRYMMSR